ncbi:DUF4303 domain-containing protein [Microbacterium sp. NPDC091382]|uniref:DUF4303 domain-containing protein n=1 Tax=Microbacterium sp. NPDC091382 TaxID=3364210 RepID=UPI00380BD95B
MTDGFHRPAIPDDDLATQIAQATQEALAELPLEVRDGLCLVALLTTGEALRPYLSLTTHGDDQWNLADSPFAIIGDGRFAALDESWSARGMLADLGPDASLAEFLDRMATLEEALRVVDVSGVFGAGEPRERVLLSVSTMPPDRLDVGYVRRLNPHSVLHDRWFAEAAEGPVLRAQPGDRPPASDAHISAAPNPSLAGLWRVTDGLELDDGTTLYSAADIAERNETYEVAEYAPGWLLVGDVSGGYGYLMRSAPGEFRPERGRSAAEVFRLDLGAITSDVPGEADFVTDDLVGWIATRRDAL